MRRESKKLVKSVFFFFVLLGVCVCSLSLFSFVLLRVFMGGLCPNESGVWVVSCFWLKEKRTAKKNKF